MYVVRGKVMFSDVSVLFTGGGLDHELPDSPPPKKNNLEAPGLESGLGDGYYVGPWATWPTHAFPPDYESPDLPSPSPDTEPPSQMAEEGSDHKQLTCPSPQEGPEDQRGRTNEEGWPDLQRDKI